MGIESVLLIYKQNSSYQLYNRYGLAGSLGRTDPQTCGIDARQITTFHDEDSVARLVSHQFGDLRRWRYRPLS